jgi:hypothetical protein
VKTSWYLQWGPYRPGIGAEVVKGRGVVVSTTGHHQYAIAQRARARAVHVVRRCRHEPFRDCACREIVQARVSYLGADSVMNGILRICHIGRAAPKQNIPVRQVRGCCGYEPCRCNGPPRISGNRRLGRVGGFYAKLLIVL